ncbi:hypothetical protein J23TS9_42500 [Paenibacillus sp. J23TS9]|uniref:recombinase family protein n=1 Tax=Paenibacillus sp. J23TS9 TaxID=2807193 RepID=UPI001B190D59|nr:hypothetical protein J23TS9_42500 [Paenibacillus sp. J23TS9]
MPRTLDELEIGFRSITENFENSTPIGKFALQFKAAVTELELESGKENYHDQQAR